MWEIRKSKPIGVKTFWELYKTMPNGETIIRGKWKYEAEARALADKLNEEEGYHERLR